jgi:CHAT domain-containing protein
MQHFEESSTGILLWYDRKHREHAASLPAGSRSLVDDFPVWIDGETMMSRRLTASALGLAGLTLALVGWRHFNFEPTLAGLLGGFRPLEGRLSELDHLPYRAPSTQAANDPRIGAAVRGLFDSAGRLLPGQLSRLLLFEVLLGRSEDAVEELEHRVGVSPRDARLLSDLSAALVARSRQRRKPADLVLALSAASRAVVAAPGFREARFNLALCLEKLFLVSQATEAWKVVAQGEPGSPWAAEAEAHQQALSQRAPTWVDERPSLEAAILRGDRSAARAIVDRHRQEARLYAEGDLLTTWARREASGRSEDAARALTLARGVGAIQAEEGGDRMAHDAVAAIDQAVAAVDHRRLNALQRGHLAYGEALALAGNDLDSEALKRFQEAAIELGRGGSPLRGWALVHTQFCHLYLGHSASSLEAEPGLLRDFPASIYPALTGEAQRVAGIAHLRLGNLAESLRRYRTALSCAERTHEPESLAAAHFNLAENLRFQGVTEEAWEHRYQALALASQTARAVFLHNARFDAAEAALKEGLPEVALCFQTEMVAAALPRQDALTVAETLLRRSRSRHRLVDDPAALRDVEEASRWIPRIASVARRNQIAADLEMARGEIALDRDPQAAAEHFREAITYYRGRDDRFRLPGLYQKSAAALLSSGQDGPAEADLDAGIAESEAQRQRVLDAQLRVSYLEQFQPVFDEMIRLQAERKRDLPRAFDYAERSRARTLLDLLGNGGILGKAPHTLRLSELQRELPPDVGVLEYAVLPDRPFVWGITRTGFAGMPLPIGSVELTEQVDRFRRSLQTGGSAKERAQLGRGLYQALVAPISSSLGGVSTWVIVPDKALHALPFAALINPATQRYLLEEKAISYAPSATLYIRALQRDRILAAGGGTGALVLGNPAFDQALFSDLPNLKGAEDEARGVADLYRAAAWRSDLRLGRDATRKAFLTLAPQATVIHLAAHARVNTEYPLLSALALAPDPASADPGALYAHEIYRLRLEKTRLVVLAACRSAGGRLSQGEGLSSLARPFLAAGAPAVIGSLWKLNDQDAQSFFLDFHRRLLAGEDAVGALRQAQLACLGSPDKFVRDPSLWAALQLVGGVARREQL